jgi:hypothetical protein
MDFNQALTYSFEDKQWMSKLAILALMLILSLIPVLGLLPLMLALGFLTQVIEHVRNGLPRPLPKWGDYNAKLTLGGYVLLAMVLYNLPLIVLLMLTNFFVSVLGGGFLGVMANFVMFCCGVPVFLLYVVLAWSMLAAALTEYATTHKPRVFYRPVHLFDMVRAHGNLTAKWALFATLVNVFSIMASVTVIGSPLVLFFMLPIHGHLLGQYARQLAIKVA